MADPISLIVYGIFGGILSEFLNLYQYRQTGYSKLPKYLKSPFYWILTIGMILCGGGLVAMYLSWGWSLNGFLAMNIGATAPLIIGKLVSKEPKID